MSPLLEAGLTKEETRKLVRRRELSVADKPSSPCLASRIPFGAPITVEKIKRIEEAERYLHSLGFQTVRVRDHDGIARIEVNREKIPKLVTFEGKISEKLKGLGYDYVAVDLEGYKMGGLNPAQEK